MKTAKPALFFYTAFIFLLGLSVSDASASCYIDCMQNSGCWLARSDENVSYCSGTQARCSTECRDASETYEKLDKSYGAIAYSKKNGVYGFSDGWKTKGKAKKTAMQYCKQNNGDHCKIMVWFYNQCGAVAVDGKKVSPGLGETIVSANEDALKECQKGGKKNCVVKVTHCSL